MTRTVAAAARCRLRLFRIGIVTSAISNLNRPSQLPNQADRPTRRRRSALVRTRTWPTEPSRRRSTPCCRTCRCQGRLRSGRSTHSVSATSCPHLTSTRRRRRVQRSRSSRRLSPVSACRSSGDLVGVGGDAQPPDAARRPWRGTDRSAGSGQQADGCTLSCGSESDVVDDRLGPERFLADMRSGKIAKARRLDRLGRTAKGLLTLLASVTSILSAGIRSTGLIIQKTQTLPVLLLLLQFDAKCRHNTAHHYHNG